MFTRKMMDLDLDSIMHKLPEELQFTVLEADSIRVLEIKTILNLGKLMDQVLVLIKFLAASKPEEDHHGLPK
jgi:hypothetical protein